MDLDLKLPDPQICRTRRLYTTQFYLCLVDSPVNCPQLSIVREFHLCNHYFKDNFAEEKKSCDSAVGTKTLKCEQINSCSLIQNMSNIVPFTINMVKLKYCEFNKNRCARYELLQVYELDEIPVDLWPNDEIKALELLELKLNETHKKLYGIDREEIPD